MIVDRLGAAWGYRWLVAEDGGRLAPLSTHRHACSVNGVALPNER